MRGMRAGLGQGRRSSFVRGLSFYSYLPLSSQKGERVSDDRRGRVFSRMEN